MEISQKTIKEELSFDGIGVHSGLSCKVTLKPANENSGIIFRNIKYPNVKIEVGKVCPDNSQYSTSLSSSEWRIGTIEHLLAAVTCLQIDNLMIEVDGEEIPILDGSSFPFIKEILRVGIDVQNAKKNFLTPRKMLYFEDLQHERELIFSPAQKYFCLNEKDGSVLEKFDKNLYIDYKAEFENPVLGAAEINCCLTQDLFINEISPARTFGFLEQLPFMQQNGLAKGASLENTVVITKNGYVNERRFEDEFVRHKLLDLLGDLSLTGFKLAGKIKAKRTGHNFNRKIVEHYLKNPSDWMLI